MERCAVRKNITLDYGDDVTDVPDRVVVLAKNIVHRHNSKKVIIVLSSIKKST